ncbi:MAG: leucyl aminopeptidase [Planctomycetia bacterium 21-64-5]|nr:MAG: leucyl aminopeptidase [Planctomycetia bacterium 21-64-5]
MQISTTDQSVIKVSADAAVVGVFADTGLNPAAVEADRASGGLLTRLIENKEISGKLYELTPLWGAAGIEAPQLLVAGLGKQAEYDRGLALRTAAAAARQLAAKERPRVAFYLTRGASDAIAESGIAGAIMGCQGQDLYRAEKKRFPFAELLWAGATEQAIEAGRVLGESVNLARRLVNEPPQELYPETFAARAAEMAEGYGLAIELWDLDRLQREGCGSLLAVSHGSVRPPRLVILRHHGGPADRPPLAFVGKGVTFDSGGLSLKPNDSMKTMKCDMSGAAAVLAAMTALARLKLPVNVVGLMGLVENMPSGSAMKLGDVLRARNGKTIEVMNTDAEGRLVLADVLDVAVAQKPSAIVDLATLTGACVVALGIDVAGAMTNDQPWCDRVMAAARDCGEPLWQLPMYADYGEDIRSEVADIRNTGEGRWAGAIAGAKFLEEFVDDVPWVHLDIAGPAFLEKPKPWLDAGGSGVFVRTLVELARQAR